MPHDIKCLTSCNGKDFLCKSIVASELASSLSLFYLPLTLVNYEIAHRPRKRVSRDRSASDERFFLPVFSIFFSHVEQEIQSNYQAQADTHLLCGKREDKQ